MYEVTEFYVQPVSGSPIKFRDPGEARTEAERLGRRGGPVMLFSVKGWPRFDIWDRPRLVATFSASVQPSGDRPCPPPQRA